MTLVKNYSPKHIMVLAQSFSSKMIPASTQWKHQHAKPSRAVLAEPRPRSVHVNCSSPPESPVSFLLSLCVTILLPRFLCPVLFSSLSLSLSLALICWGCAIWQLKGLLAFLILRRFQKKKKRKKALLRSLSVCVWWAGVSLGGALTRIYDPLF